MMKYFSIAVLLGACLLYAVDARSQNLIADPGFEDWNGSSASPPSSLSSLTHWYTANGTADHHHVDIEGGSNLTGLEPCPLGQGNTWCGMPYEGGGVLGVWKGNGPDGSKEWAGTQLLEPLVPGDCYEISFWIQNKKDNPAMLYETNHWGVFFNHTQFPAFNANLSDFSTMADHWVTCEEVIGGSEWQQVTFSYTASEAFQYMYIGYVGNVSNSTFTAHNDDYLLGFYVWIDQVVVEHVDVDVPEDPTICRGDSILLEFASNYSLSWTDGVNGDTTHSVWVAPETTTTYYVEAVGNQGCTKVDSVTVEVLQETVVDYPEAVCVATEPFLLSSEGIAGSWTGDGIVDAVGSFDPSLVGEGMAEVRFTSSTDCAEDFTLLIEVAPVPETDFAVDVNTGCWPLDVQLSDSAPVPGLAYEWAFGDGTTAMDGAVSAHTFAEAGIYEPSVIITHFENCTVSYPEVVRIQVYDTPQASFSFTPDQPDLVNSEVQFTDESTGDVVSWQWDFGDLRGSAQRDPLHAYEAPGAYQVQLQVTGLGNCVDVQEQTLIVENAVRMYVPNAFSPNLDGINDRFGIGYIGELYEYKMTIFDRWGGLVYQSTDPLSPWEGRRPDGRFAEQGVYLYQIEYILLPATATGQEQREVVSGDVTLLR